jgi:hypothetical protein
MCFSTFLKSIHRHCRHLAAPHYSFQNPLKSPPLGRRQVLEEFCVVAVGKRSEFRHKSVTPRGQG